MDIPYISNWEEYPDSYNDCHNLYFYNYGYEDSLSTCTSQYWASDSAGTWTLELESGESLSGIYSGGLLLVDGGYEIDTTSYDYYGYCGGKFNDLWDSFSLVHSPQFWYSDIVLEKPILLVGHKLECWASEWNLGRKTMFLTTGTVSITVIMAILSIVNDTLSIQVNNLLEFSPFNRLCIH